MSYPSPEEVLENHKLDPLVVKHSELTRVSDHSFYRSACPECEEGVLLVKRNPPPSLELQEDDHCIRCGRRFIYEDIKEMREKLG